jgi:cyanophycinase-like exopeptidase
MTRLLVLMGSGETAPTMIKPHREFFTRLGDAPAVVLDTPYGFQENADDISDRAVAYFDASVGRKVTVVSWRGRDLPPAARARALADLGDAGWIFAGPGSPTYALRQWRDTEVPQLITDRLKRGGVVIFASAAALTLGSHTVPVYEIYKAGEPPGWAEGLDIVRQVTGMPVVVVPHYDNAEGGHHDTRFCYLGERRLSLMEQMLPDDTFIIGVDEHTAVTLDLEAGTATVSGNGTMTIRRRGTSTVFPSGTVLTFDELSRECPGTASARPLSDSTDRSGATPAADQPAPAILAAEADRLNATFAAAAAAGDADGCVAALLDLDQLLTEWSSDLSDDVGYARTVFRQMIVRLGDLAGTVDPKSTALPAVLDLVFEIRSRARASRDFATADAIRDKLGTAGIEIRDTPDGATWHLN